MLALEQFRATKRVVANLSAVAPNSDLEGRPGLVYDGDCYIETRPDPVPDGVSWGAREYFLNICNEDWSSDDLAGLEDKLYHLWYVSECTD